MVLVLGLGSGSVGTHPVLYILVPCQSPLPNLSVLPVVLRARMRAVRSCRFDRAPFGDRAPRGARTTRGACHHGVLVVWEGPRWWDVFVCVLLGLSFASCLFLLLDLPLYFVLSADALVVDLLRLLCGPPQLGGCR